MLQEDNLVTTHKKNDLLITLIKLDRVERRSAFKWFFFSLIIDKLEVAEDKESKLLNEVAEVNKALNEVAEVNKAKLGKPSKADRKERKREVKRQYNKDNEGVVDQNVQVANDSDWVWTGMSNNSVIVQKGDFYKVAHVGDQVGSLRIKKIDPENNLVITDKGVLPPRTH